MALDINALRAAFKSEDRKSSRPNNYYPFWNISEGESATVRFLPDKNDENPMGFLVEKLMHTLVVNGENRSVPCLRMYGDDCPICKVSSAFYKENDKTNGKKYWRKKQHLAQALIIDDPLPADEDSDENHEGKVRFLNMGFQIFNVIKEAFEGGELDEVPFAFENGCNFIIKKTRQGEHPNYSVGSRFARKSTDLTADEIALVQDHMVDLSSLLPQKPALEKVEAMLEAALTGTEYVEEGSSEKSSSAITAAVSKAKKPAVADADADDVPFETDAEVAVKAEAPAEASSDEEFDDEADKILAQIRSRKGSKA